MRFQAEVVPLAALLCALTAVPAGAQGTGAAPVQDQGRVQDQDPVQDQGPVQDPESEAESESEAEPESESEAESVPDPEPEPDPESDRLIAERTANSAAYVRKRTAALELALRGAQQDERDAQLWVPWAITGTGVAAVATGLVLGAIPTAACDDSCSRPFWLAALVVGGAAVATAGTLWLVINERDQAELRLRRARIEQQLEHERWNAAPIGRLQLSLSGRL